jgi:pimeloyl-ACP methyl ester carboxylesterase
MNKMLRGVLLAGAAVAVPATINAVIAARSKRFEGSLPGDIAYYDWIFGRVAYYRVGHGDPLLLVHNPNAGGSAWEWRQIFLDLANAYTVYAIDLLGFGLSEKPQMAYSGALFADLVHDFVADVLPGSTYAIGSGLGASYLVNVAVRRPERFRALVLVNPTGTTSTAHPLVETANLALLRTPVLGESVYNAMVSWAALARELTTHIYYDPEMATPEVIDSLHAATHQPGSRYAASAFVAGRLDLPLRMPFSLLDRPTMLVWGRDAFYTPLADAADLLYRHPETRLEIFDECGMLPHDERAGAFVATIRPFLVPPVEEMGQEAA